MKTFTITYRMSVSITANNEDEAQELFENTNLGDLDSQFVEQVSIEEEF